MFRELAQSLWRCPRMFADEAQPDNNRFSGACLTSFSSISGLASALSDETNLFVPCRIDVVQLTRAGVNQFFSERRSCCPPCDGQIVPSSDQNAEQNAAVRRKTIWEVRVTLPFSFLCVAPGPNVACSLLNRPNELRDGAGSRMFFQRGCSIWSSFVSTEAIMFPALVG